MAFSHTLGHHCFPHNSFLSRAPRTKFDLTPVRNTCVGSHTRNPSWLTNPARDSSSYAASQGKKDENGAAGCEVPLKGRNENLLENNLDQVQRHEEN